MADDKKIVVYNYKRGKDTFTTPNVEIAINRRGGEEDIQVETRLGDDVQMSTLIID